MAGLIDHATPLTLLPLDKDNFEMRLPSQGFPVGWSQNHQQIFKLDFRMDSFPVQLSHSPVVFPGAFPNKSISQELSAQSAFVDTPNNNNLLKLRYNRNVTLQATIF